MACLIAYLQRAFDSGTVGYVYWSSMAPDPSPVLTTPQFTGTLTAYAIIERIEKDI